MTSQQQGGTQVMTHDSKGNTKKDLVGVANSSTASAVLMFLPPLWLLFSILMQLLTVFE